MTNVAKATSSEKTALPLITTEEALRDLLDTERDRSDRPADEILCVGWEAQLDKLASRVALSEDETEQIFEEALTRADYGSTNDTMPIEQWLMMHYGRADDLIAAYSISVSLALLGIANGLEMERRHGRSYVESTPQFERRFGVRVKLRLLQ